MLGRWIAGLLLWAALVGVARAQEAPVWVQVEAQPTLERAEVVAQGYASQLPDVAGYDLGSGWFGIVLGPYDPADAAILLDRLRADGIIPGDSFLADGSQFGAQIWPVGVGAATAARPLPGADEAALDGAALDDVPETAPPLDLAAEDLAAATPLPPDESPREARASEALLSPGERERLQVALGWAGVYDGAIDGAYGPGTRAAMALWQAENGFESTGILTTRERAVLLAAYDGILDGLGIEVVRDLESGIEVAVPLGIVARQDAQPPFVRFAPTEDFGAEVILISQPGDRDRLWGLYEIMQTLEVVPPEGPRERTEAGFTIEGMGADTHSTTEVTLEASEIKGFTLVWPAGDEARRVRVLAEMRASFRRLPGVLDPGALGAEQAVDLVSGLAVRRARGTATGFFVDEAGRVATAAGAVEGCERLTLDEAHGARVAAVDEALGLAVLEPDGALAPRAVAAFQTGVPRLEDEVAVAGFPYGGVLARPALTFGRLADLRGLNGEAELRRLDLAALAGDAGGPVFDAGGAVVGMLLPPAEGGPVLPAGVSLALDAASIQAALARAGIAPVTAGPAAPLSPERLSRAAAGLAVLVSCW